MFEHIIAFSIRFRWIVLGLTGAMAVLGVISLQKLSIDAVPDITNVQVQINTEMQGFSPFEIEQRVTYPLETALNGLPRLEETRSLSRYGLSQITVVFKEGTNIYFARQLINERLAEAREKLPEGAESVMGPVTTGLGEIFMWTLSTDNSVPTLSDLTDLRTVQDWVIKPQLRTIPGVVEVNTIGGYEKQYHITPYPEKLLSYGLSLSDVVEAVHKSNASVGAGYIERQGEQYIIRAPGQIRSLEEVRQMVLQTRNGIPIRIQDVADVQIGQELRSGAGTKNGAESIVGTVFMLLGENSRTVSKQVAQKMTQIQSSLPKGIKATVVYDRTTLVDKTIHTVKKNLLEGALLVIAVLFLLLGNFRAAIICALIIPLSMLFAITGMVGNKVSANLMSLGAIDFGIIVDGAVVIVENCIRQLAESQARLGRPLTLEERLKVVFDAAKEVRRPLLMGQAIIMVVYLPILTLSGIEGKLFHPMAFTVLAALLGAMILSITFLPAAIAVFLNGRISEKDSVVMRLSKKVYAPLLELAIGAKRVVLTASLVLLVLTFLILTQMGSEFVPSLDEGDIALHALRIPGTSLSQSLDMQKTVEKTLGAFPEIKTVFSKIGTAEIATDPMPPNVADTFVMLKARSQWPDPKKTKAQLVSELEAGLQKLPGNNYEFTQPIQMRFNELIAGVRADVAVKIFGDDMDLLLDNGNKIASILQGIPGAADVRVEQVSGLPLMTVSINRENLARFGLQIADVQSSIETALGGKTVGELIDGDRRYKLVVRLPESIRSNPEALKRFPILIPDGANKAGSSSILLEDVADIALTEGPNQISRENGKRRIVITTNVRDRDLGSFVQEAQESVKSLSTLPAGYWSAWGGQYDNLITAKNRLQIVVPVAFVLIFSLLFVTFKSVKDSLLVFTAVPFALTGGVLALWVRGIPLSISAGVGFIALSGVAVLNGMVLVSFIKHLEKIGHSALEAVRLGALTRLRPVLMTGLVASLGFIPMAFATGTGAEVQRPLATVVIGGILSSTVLTLIVLPVLYLALQKMKWGKLPKKVDRDHLI